MAAYVAHDPSSRYSCSASRSRPWEFDACCHKASQCMLIVFVSSWSFVEVDRTPTMHHVMRGSSAFASRPVPSPEQSSAISACCQPQGHVEPPCPCCRPFPMLKTIMTTFLAKGGPACCPWETHCAGGVNWGIHALRFSTDLPLARACLPNRCMHSGTTLHTLHAWCLVCMHGRCKTTILDSADSF